MSRRYPTEPVPRLRDFLRRTGQKKWGWVIYRCTYADDAAWTRFLEILTTRVHDGVNFYSAAEREGVLEKFEWRVMSDPTTLDGARPSDIRPLFRAWIQSDEAKAEQGEGEVEYPESYFIGGHCARYHFCVHVDAECVDSVIKKAPQPPEHDNDGIAFVNLVQLDWATRDPATFDWYGTGMDPEVDDINDDDCEPIDGCRREDVGYMRVRVDGLAPVIYAMLQKPEIYDDIYVRPPEVWTRI